eukprot:scaffold1668_cov113-Isochrysis_galbana.AAC.4
MRMTNPRPGASEAAPSTSKAWPIAVRALIHRLHRLMEGGAARVPQLVQIPADLPEIGDEDGQEIAVCCLELGRYRRRIQRQDPLQLSLSVAGETDRTERGEGARRVRLLPRRLGHEDDGDGG